MLIAQNSSLWDGQDEILTLRAIFVATLTVTTRCGGAMWAVVEIQERCRTGINNEDDIATSTTITTIRSA
jgi:hypothetical protein